MNWGLIVHRSLPHANLSRAYLGATANTSVFTPPVPTQCHYRCLLLIQRHHLRHLWLLLTQMTSRTRSYRSWSPRCRPLSPPQLVDQLQGEVSQHSPENTSPTSHVRPWKAPHHRITHRTYLRRYKTIQVCRCGSPDSQTCNQESAQDGVPHIATNRAYARGGLPSSSKVTNEFSMPIPADSVSLLFFFFLLECIHCWIFTFQL